MTNWITAMIVADAVITVLVLWLVLRRPRRSALGAAEVDVPGLWQFAAETEGRIGEFVRTRYDGRPETLPHVLEALLDELEIEARARGLTLSRETLKAMLVQSLAARRLAPPPELRAALANVA